ncbi:MAG: glycosyltransferase family 4 protein [Alistipes senegalensis]|nr:glycosyltransferase family 4 protein [Oxalobacter formigenes]MCM1281588.1 glycosyltransferase family 4 protein [Alistipes senegalensis]
MLPWQATRDKVDVFWGTTHRLPRYLPTSVARVVTIHDLVWKFAGETMRPLSRWLEKRLMPEAVCLADRIIANSWSTAQGIEAEFPLAKDKVRVVHLGMPVMALPSDRKSLLYFGIDRPYFLFVGTLEPRKNLRRLLGAFARLPEGVRNANLLVIAGGKGWGGVNVDALLKELKIERHVIVVGYVSNTQLSSLYAHARFLAMPSLYEGFGLPLVEAMGFGTPVLTSKVSSMPEVAGDAGFLVDPLDEAAIAEGVGRLLTDEALRQSLANKAKTNVIRFSWRKAAKEMMGVFAEAIQERRSGYRI